MKRLLHPHRTLPISQGILLLMLTFTAIVVATTRSVWQAQTSTQCSPKLAAFYDILDPRGVVSESEARTAVNNLINFINTNGMMDVSQGANLQYAFMDLSGDGRLSPVDVLKGINGINGKCFSPVTPSSASSSIAVPSSAPTEASSVIATQQSSSTPTQVSTAPLTLHSVQLDGTTVIVEYSKHMNTTKNASVCATLTLRAQWFDQRSNFLCADGDHLIATENSVKFSRRLNYGEQVALKSGNRISAYVPVETKRTIVIPPTSSQGSSQDTPLSFSWSKENLPNIIREVRASIVPHTTYDRMLLVKGKVQLPNPTQYTAIIATSQRNGASYTEILPDGSFEEELFLDEGRDLHMTITVTIEQKRSPFSTIASETLPCNYSLPGVRFDQTTLKNGPNGYLWNIAAKGMVYYWSNDFLLRLSLGDAKAEIPVTPGPVMSGTFSVESTVGKLGMSLPSGTYNLSIELVYRKTPSLVLLRRDIAPNLQLTRSANGVLWVR